MIEFFKKMFRGLLLIVIAPFAVIIFAVYLIYGFVVFIVLGIKSAFLFLKGSSILEPTDFDKAASDIVAADLEKKNAAPVAAQPSQAIYVLPIQTITPNQVPPTNTVVINEQIPQLGGTIEEITAEDVVVKTVGEDE